jgi:hypothetical protein
VLGQVEFAYNTKVHSSSKYSPYYLMFGRDPVLPVHILTGTRAYTETSHDYVKDMTMKLSQAHAQAFANIECAQTKQAKYHDRGTRFIEYKPHDKVYYKNPTRENKLSRRWKGPYTVQAKSASGHDYTLIDLTNPNPKSFVVHHDKLKPYVASQNPDTPSGFKVPEPTTRPSHPTTDIILPPPPPHLGPPIQGTSRW